MVRKNIARNIVMCAGDKKEQKMSLHPDKTTMKVGVTYEQRKKA